MKTTLEIIRLVVSSPTHYAIRLARSVDDIRAAQSLRFQVFNLELHEGLEQSYATGRDEDPFDAVCDHLIVEHLPSANIVGTYRLQTGALVVLFPEGPSSDGQTVLPFKSSLLEPAARQAHPLSAGLIQYALGDGNVCLSGAANPCETGNGYFCSSGRSGETRLLRTALATWEALVGVGAWSIGALSVPAREPKTEVISALFLR